MKRGLDIIQAMMRPLDELHARRAAKAAEQQLAEAKALFERDAEAAGSHILWLGDITPVFVPVKLVPPR